MSNPSPGDEPTQAPPPDPVCVAALRQLERGHVIRNWRVRWNSSAGTTGGYVYTFIAQAPTGEENLARDAATAHALRGVPIPARAA